MGHPALARAPDDELQDDAASAHGHQDPADDLEVDAADVVLTPRETEVLRLLAAGRTNRQVGAELHISEKTATVHGSNILAELGASGRTEAVALAARRDLLPAG